MVTTYLNGEQIAEIQLLEALELAKAKRWVPAITLAGAAEEILGKRLRKIGKEPSFDNMKEAVVKIAHDLGETDPNLEKDVAYLINLTKNELKHYTGDETIEFDLEQDGVEILERAMVNYTMLTGIALSEFTEFWAHHDET